ncbi:hypothetical protein V6N13_072596 [Hibiscus sabdariffa]
MSFSQHPINVEPSATIMLSFYKSLWELNLPAKCTIFFWQLMHNFLPTFDNLQLRRLQVRNTCRFCEAAADSATHFALMCPITLGILASVGFSPVPTMQQLEFCETLASWFVQGTKRHQMLIVISYWALWHARNEIVHEGRPFSAVRVSSFILSFLFELESSIAVPAPNSLVKDVKWFPPDENIIKLNFDASFNTASKSSVSGIVARDSHASEEVELVLHSKDDKLLPQNRCDPYHLCSIRSHCLSVLRALQDFLSELKLPSAMDKASIVQFYFQSATLLNSTACSSYKLYNFEMKPLNFLVIKEATQLKECEPAIPMQFSDIVRSVLIGDKWKFSATVISYVSSEAGFRRKSISKVDYFGSFKASTEYSVQNASIY